MAERKDPPPADTRPPDAPIAPDPAMLAAARAAAEPFARQADVARAAAEAAARRADETVPGGKYRVGGHLVNAEGQPVAGVANPRAD